MGIMCALTEPNYLKILGIGLIKVLKMNEQFQVLLQKGLSFPLIQNLFELFKSEICENSQGTSIVPLDDFSIFLNYFENPNEEKLVMIYMYDKDNSDIYSQLYLHSLKIKKSIFSNSSISELKKSVTNTINIPKTNGVKGLYILGLSGIPYFSKTHKKENDMDDSQLVAGLISALFSFSQHLIGENSGGQLKEINFGNQVFYTITKGDVIFVFLVENMTPLVRRYMYILADEFLDTHQQDVKNFHGNISPFRCFGEIIDQYFII